MGDVYCAKDTNLGRQVAIEVLPEQFTHDPQPLSRFERETQLHTSLNYPNVDAIHGLGESHGVWFLVLELVGGTTLGRAINERPKPHPSPFPHTVSWQRIVFHRSFKGVINENHFKDRLCGFACWTICRTGHLCVG